MGSEDLMDYAIDLQRAIEAHCHGKKVGEWGKSDPSKCPHHAKMLDKNLAEIESLRAERDRALRAVRLVVSDDLQEAKMGFDRAKVLAAEYEEADGGDTPQADG